MDFEFAENERAFIAEVRSFVASQREQDEADGVFAPNREAILRQGSSCLAVAGKLLFEVQEDIWND